LCEAIRKILTETKVKCEDEPGSLVNYYQKLLKNDVPEKPVIEPRIMQNG